MSSQPVRYHLGKFPPSELDWPQLIPLISAASLGLGKYNGLLSAIPNAHILLSPLTTQEAVLSSKIEGTHITLSEVLEIEAGGESAAITPSKRADAEEVRNYREALQACAAAMEHRPLSQQLLRSAHGILMRGVRGQDKSPGSYRNEQNWIGRQNYTKIEDATFVPTAPENLQSGMDAWEHYLKDTSVPDPLTQLAILHIEFEALHPFKDGNGRLGRMLIPLFLYQRKLLRSPDFYMSGYLESNRDEYQERLRAVSRDDDWTGWCKFFLQGIHEQATENERRAQAILDLYKRVKEQVFKLVKSQYSIQAVDFLFKVPRFMSTAFTKHSGIPESTAERILVLLRTKTELLTTIQEGKARRPGIYAFKELVDVADGK